MIVFLLTLAAAPPSSIVVTGRPDLKSELDACIKRRCSTEDDVAATIHYADAAFVAGDYDQARHALYASIGRNRSAAADHPQALSDLYSAYETVSKHLGEVDGYRLGSWHIQRTAEHGRDVSVENKLIARIEVADMLLSTATDRGLARYHDASNAYRSISRDAQRAGLPVEQAASDIRLAPLLYAVHRNAEGHALLVDVSTRPGPELAHLRLNARVLLQRIERSREQPDVTAIATDPLGLPDSGDQEVIWSPPSSDTPIVERDANDHPIRSESTSFHDSWVDVGFHVEPDGRVSDVRIIRSGENKPVPWAKGEMMRIAGRLYSPVKPGGASSPTDRIERLTYTSRWVPHADGPFPTNMPGRDGIPRIEHLDLTGDRNVPATAKNDPQANP